MLSRSPRPRRMMRLEMAMNHFRMVPVVGLRMDMLGRQERECEHCHQREN